MTRLLSAVPIVPGRDVVATTAWYRDHLGFTVRRVYQEGYAVIERDEAELHFWGPSGIEPHDSTTMVRIRVREIRELYETCSHAGVVHPDAPLTRKPRGTEEFAVSDCDCNLVTFFER